MKVLYGILNKNPSFFYVNAFFFIIQQNRMNIVLISWNL